MMLSPNFSRFVLLLAAVVLLAKGEVWAQDGLSVASFSSLPNDMTARTIAPERDANGDLTALIKVVTTEQGFDFDGGSLGIVKVLPQPGEIWVYVPDRARSITVRHGKLGVLRNYAYPEPVRAGSVYEMKLSHGVVEVVIKPREIVTEWLVINSTPAGADVYLNEQAVGKTPYSAELPEGRYTWRVERNLYQTEAGVAELKSGDRVALELALKPNFGRVTVESLPEQGAKVLLNGIDIGKQTPCSFDELPVGTYTFTLSHEWYETKTETVEVKAGDKLEVRSELQPNFGELRLVEQSGVKYMVNSREVSESLLRLAPGVYSVEARKENHKPSRAQVVIERGQRKTPELEPQAMLGRLRVQSQPFGATISLDGKEEGETPYTYREVLVGQHEVVISKDGYADEIHRVEVKEGETTDLTVELKPVGGESVSGSSPDAAPAIGSCVTLEGEEREKCTQREISRHVAENTIYPKLAQMTGIQGKVYVSFVINKGGTISNARVVRSVDDLLDAEALRVVNSLPKFEPGRKDGQAISIEYTIPITFKLDDGEGSARTNSTNSAINLGLLESIVRGYYEACGGLNRLEQVTSYQDQAVITLDSEGMKFDYAKVLKMPDKAKLTTSMSGFKMEQILNGDEAANITNGVSERLDYEQAQGLRAMVDLTAMMDWLADPSSVVFVGMRDYRGETYQVIEVDDQLLGKTNYYFDPSTKLLAATEVTSNANGVEVTVITWIRAYTQVDGLKFPRTFEIDTGTNNMNVEVSFILLNQPVDDDVFRIP